MINITVTVDNWNIVYLSPSTGDPQTAILMLRLIHPRGGNSEMLPLVVSVKIEVFPDKKTVNFTTRQITLPSFIEFCHSEYLCVSNALTLLIHNLIS